MHKKVLVPIGNFGQQNQFDNFHNAQATIQDGCLHTILQNIVAFEP